LQAPFNLFQVESKGFLYSRGKEGFQPIKQFAENLRPLEAWGRDIHPQPLPLQGMKINEEDITHAPNGVAGEKAIAHFLKA
jgi:hypothetical protein